MNVSAPFIARPVATTLLTVAIAIAGAIAFFLLPVATLPQVDSPTLSVTAGLPGASPETVAATVAAPLERTLGRIAGVSELTSSSAQGTTTITVQFELDRDIDGAARDVQAALAAARASLPAAMPANPTWRKVNPADFPVVVLALTSTIAPRGAMYDVAASQLQQRLSQVEGVGQVTLGGASLPAVRIEVDLLAANRVGIGMDAVRRAVVAANGMAPKGVVEDGDHAWIVAASDQAPRAADWRSLVLAWRDGAPVRLTDVADVRDGIENVRTAGFANGRPSVLLNVYRQPNANVIETAQRVLDLLPQLEAMVPGTVELSVVAERTGTIRASLREVERALAIAVGLVVLVVFLFLKRGAATVIPVVAVPVSLIGTFGVMWWAGYSLNNLSLMALTVATGFVVDDAIVVLENVSRHLEAGMTPVAASLRGAREVSFTVVSMSVSLAAVFIPVLFMGGIVGRLFREFAVTLVVAIGISLVVSLTTTPMLCARWLRRVPAAPAAPADASRPPRRGIATRIADGYARSVGVALDHPWVTLLLLAGVIALNVWLYVIVPKGFFPQQDTGRLGGFVSADQSISFEAMQQKFRRVLDIVRADPAVASVSGNVGGTQRNTGNFFLMLKPVAERKDSADAVVARLRPQFATITGMSTFLAGGQDIRIGGRLGSAQYQYTLLGDSLETLREWAPKLVRVLSQSTALADVYSDQQLRGLQNTVIVDRDAAARLGVSMRSIDAVLGTAFGQAPVSTIYAPLNQYRVVLEAAPPYTRDPATLADVRVPAADGTGVPLTALARVVDAAAPVSINRQSQAVATTVSFNLPIGRSLGYAVKAIKAAEREAGLPSTIEGMFAGTAKLFQASLDSQPWLIGAAILTVYLVLGILYESLVHPLTILSTLPSAGVGALAALMLTGTEFTLIALIGVLLLVGIVKKNAILMVDFALDAQRTQGLDPRAAIHAACRLRLRPILMTTAAAALG
ncbi:MAG: efflux RND transporter permease subunit, partial [Burkholderiales bacterium]|nr:efflux RND transporter permease subunit [Burkholderiales bacterium]